MSALPRYMAGAQSQLEARGARLECSQACVGDLGGNFPSHSAHKQLQGSRLCPRGPVGILLQVNGSCSG